MACRLLLCLLIRQRRISSFVQVCRLPSELALNSYITSLSGRQYFQVDWAGCKFRLIDFLFSYSISHRSGSQPTLNSFVTFLNKATQAMLLPRMNLKPPLLNCSDMQQASVSSPSLIHRHTSTLFTSWPFHFTSSSQHGCFN